MDNLNYEFINPSVGAWGTSAYATFTELYCDEIKAKKILIFLNTDDAYRGFMNNYYKLINGELAISKVELTSINKELSRFDRHIPFYRILKKNSHLFILTRNVVYDFLNPAVLNEWSSKHYYPHPAFIKNYKLSKELFEYNKKIFLRLNDLSKKCGSELYVFYTGWANIEKMNENNPNKFFFWNVENFFKKNNIYYFNNSKKMTQLYKSPINYIIKEDYHPNKKGADLIYNLVSDEIKNILLN